VHLSQQAQEPTESVAGHNWLPVATMSGVAPTSPCPVSQLLLVHGSHYLEVPVKSSHLAGYFSQQTRAAQLLLSSPLTVCAPAHSPLTKPTADQQRHILLQEPTTASLFELQQAQGGTESVAGHNSLLVEITSGVALTCRSHRTSTSVPTVRVVYVFANFISLKY